MKHFCASSSSRRLRTARRGTALIYMGATLTLTIGFAAFSFDISRFRSAQGELEALADAAALNAANGLANNTYAAKAIAVAAENKVDDVAASISASAVVPGYWSGTAFTANGTPRNAVKVTVARKKGDGTQLNNTLASSVGWASPDLVASSTVALVQQGEYEWAATNSVALTASSNAFKVTAFDATSPAAAQTLTTITSNGSVAISGPATLNANVKYGTTSTIANSTTVNGSVGMQSSASVYPPGSQVANLSGVTPAYAAATDMTVASSMTLAGGTYVMKNFTVSNCNITFTGPVTIVATGNCTFNGVGMTTYGNLPSNLKIITTTPNTTVNIVNPTKPFYADIYAPESTLNYSSAAGYYELRGRGVFKSLNAGGAGASLWYDRSLTNSSMSRKAVVVD